MLEGGRGGAGTSTGDVPKGREVEGYQKVLEGDRGVSGGVRGG